MSQIGIERPKNSSIVYILQVMKSTDRLQKHVRVHVHVVMNSRLFTHYVLNLNLSIKFLNYWWFRAS